MTTISLFMLAVWFVIATVVSAVCTYVVRDIARRMRWVCPPASHHIHGRSIPRLGGVAIYVTFVLGFAAAAALGGNEMWRDEVAVIAAASVLFIVGLIDDFRGLSARVKLAFEIAAGMLLFSGGERLFEPEIIPVSIGAVHLGQIVSLAATIGWFVLITNALNLIDGLDGLAAGSALFSIMTLFGLALSAGNSSVMAATMVLGGAVLGFLRYNFNPATIFLGDGGSLFLGAMLSGMALQPKRAAVPTFVAVAIPLVAFGLPIVETCVSIIRRFLNGKPVFSPDQDHIHHRLLRMGLSHRQTVIALYGVCAAFALLSLFLIYPGRALVGVWLILIGTIACIAVQRLGYPEMGEISRLAQRTFEQRRVIGKNVLIRKAARKLTAAHSTADLVKALDGLLRTGEFDVYAVVTPTLNIRRECKGNLIIDRRRTSLGNGPGWGLTMDLDPSEGNPLGQFFIGRAFRRRSVLVDVNLIFSEVEPALTQACVRLELHEPSGIEGSRKLAHEDAEGSPVTVT